MTKDDKDKLAVYKMTMQRTKGISTLIWEVSDTDRICGQYVAASDGMISTLAAIYPEDFTE